MKLMLTFSPLEVNINVTYHPREPNSLALSEFLLVSFKISSMAICSKSSSVSEGVAIISKYSSRCSEKVKDLN